MQNKIPIKIKGMQRDFSESASNPNLAFENKNIRIMATNDNTTLSVTNEKGNILATVEGLPNNTISGTPIGQAVLNNQLVIFTSTSCIYKIWLQDDEYNCTVLYDGINKGSLNLSDEHPIESIVFYENENLQKVYWVDGINQPRMINIAATQEEIDSWISTSFDFVQPVELKDTIELSKNFNSGNFSPGVIQYAFSYFNKYGNESPIINQTDLGYVTPQDKGAAADETVSCNFNITIENLDSKWDFIRVYSIQRTSLDATPIVKIINDYIIPEEKEYNKSEEAIKELPLNPTDNQIQIYTKEGVFINNYTAYPSASKPPLSTIFIEEDGEYIIRVFDSSFKDYIDYLCTGVLELNIDRDDYTTLSGIFITSEIVSRLIITDNGILGYTIDPTLLLYIGGEQLIANTINHKDNTLFLGNISINPNNVDGSIKEEILKIKDSIQYTLNKTIDIGNAEGQYYINNNQNNLSSFKFKTFKSGESYRLGVQLQDYKGKWSEPIWVGDFTNPANPVSYSLNDNIVYLPNIECRYSEILSQLLLQNNYKRIRPLIVFPADVDREILCQGVINPTVFRNSSRINNITYSQASWVFRPQQETYYNDSITDKNVWAQWKHGGVVGLRFPTFPNNDGNLRYNTGTGDIENSLGTITSEMQHINEYAELDSNQNEYYFVDSSIVTLNSPDIELGSIQNADSYNFRITGIIPITSLYTDKNVQTSESPYSGDGYTDVYNSRYVNTNIKAFSTDTCKPLWQDIYAYVIDNSSGNREYTFTHNYVNLWHSKTKLYMTQDNGGTLLKNNTSIFRFSKNTDYSNVRKSVDIWQPINGIYPPIIYTDSTSFIDKASINIEDRSYIGNIDQTVTPENSYYSYGSLFFRRLPLEVTTYENASGYDDRYELNSPISVKYKSTPHAVISFKESIDSTIYTENILPTLRAGYSASYNTLDWISSGGYSYRYSSENIGNSSNDDTGYLWLGELYREVDIDSKFGGNTETALQSNQWIVAGKSINLENDSRVLLWEEGDTFYQRYDCLKTYPYTLEDVNSVTDILSFMVETRINLDGRYDNNKGRLSNLVTTPTIWNLINPVYSQSNNFFNYRILQDYLYENTIFKNTITWSLTKQNNSLIDNWLSIGFINTLDLDGDKGQLRTIKRYNNELIAFQDTGISNILFNSRTQLATEQGVPIEIANSGKVDGKRYLTSSIGCSNKWSICETPKGLYFIDSINKSIYLFNGQFDNISDRLGFHSWINSNIDNIDSWTPKDFKSFITYYDKINKEVLFVKDDTCLGFSETLGNFSSFYSYEGMYYLSNIDDRSISLGTYNGLRGYGFFRHQEGDYNMFYNQYQSFYTTIIANPSVTEDKIFNNVEFRSDSWDVENITNPILEDNTFDILDVWTEYQRGTSSLSNILGKPSNLKKKFRIWRANIPRDNVNKRDRIRNTWCYIKLEKQTPNTLKTVLHDLTVNYI